MAACMGSLELVKWFVWRIMLKMLGLTLVLVFFSLLHVAYSYSRNTLRITPSPLQKKVLSWDLNFKFKPNSSSLCILAWKTFEASRVFEHMLSLGVKLNAKSLLVDAFSVIDDMVTLFPFWLMKGDLCWKKIFKVRHTKLFWLVTARFLPSKETLRKIRRRCIREMYYECYDQVESLAKKFSIRIGRENLRGILVHLDYGTEYAS